MKAHRSIMWFTMIVICVCLVSYGGYILIRNRAYARVEQLAQRHARDVAPFVGSFAGEYNLEIVYFKVFEYEDASAKVFVVLKQDPHKGKDVGGSFFHLERRDLDSDWELAKPVESVWSLYGSADGRTWPPYGLTDPFAEPRG